MSTRHAYGMWTTDDNIAIITPQVEGPVVKEAILGNSLHVFEKGG